LDNGAKFTANAMNGVDAQHLETRKHQVEEVCRFLGVMPIMVGYSDKTATYASAEQMFLAHLTHCLMPWYERIQQSADVNLLTQAERQQGYYTKLIEAGLIRGDLKTQGEYFYRMVTGGVIARNEARGLMDMNPIPGLDDPLTPTNMTTDPSGLPAGDTAK
jgi:HK97 family phage portal protein